MKRALKILISTVVCMLAAFGVACTRGLFLSTCAAEVFMALCDGTFITGALLACIGALSWISSTGQFDSFSYTKHVLVSKFNAKKNVEKYYDFKQKKEEERKSKQWNKSFAIYGCALLVLSLVFLVLYSNL